MKQNYLWVVEEKVNGVWCANAYTATNFRPGARQSARELRKAGFAVCVRKYGSLGK